MARARVKVYRHMVDRQWYAYCTHCPLHIHFARSWSNAMAWALGHASLRHPHRVVDPDIEWFRLEGARFRHEIARILDNDNRSTR